MSGARFPQRRRGPAGWRGARAQAGRYLGHGLLIVVVGLILGWIGYKASQNVPIFWTVSLNGMTLAALYFIIASGFTLIFGLMRVVNMAHGVALSARRLGRLHVQQ